MAYYKLHGISEKDILNSKIGKYLDAATVKIFLYAIRSILLSYEINLIASYTERIYLNDLDRRKGRTSLVTMYIFDFTEIVTEIYEEITRLQWTLVSYPDKYLYHRVTNTFLVNKSAQVTYPSVQTYGTLKIRLGR